ncbi:hypothetical protein ASG35_11650 [Burkholderia sp. Leaf177]|nr:hypothetical protein ASG35_11650 [Burkholderia sp. Leaf177]
MSPIKPKMTALSADAALDHLALALRHLERRGLKIELNQGMDLNYWSNRIIRVIDETSHLSMQHGRAQNLLKQLTAANK